MPGPASSATSLVMTLLGLDIGWLGFSLAGVCAALALLQRRRELVPLLCLLGAAACGDDGGETAMPSDVYPRQVAIEYKVTSTTGLAKANVMYTNDTGGFTTDDGAALPFSRSLTRTVKQYDSLSLSVASTTPGALDIDILVDGAVVETKTFSGTTVVSGSSIYAFP